jgi:alkylation response protein AidB-like acyl-CoA dehydrogenase
LVAFGTEAQINHFARPLIAGEWFGTMCLSEPQAGSGLGDIRCRAVAEGDDELGTRYRLRGNKMWISGGDQDVTENIVHLVLAKVPNANGELPAGTTGISLFIVPRVLPDGRVNDVAVAGLNHKMGYRGTANCLLNLGEGDGATGWLIGSEGDGLRQMFKMMNEARIAVGTSAAALAIRSHRHAVAYARDRTQGRLAGQRGCRPVSIMNHPDVRRMLLQQKSYAEGALALCLYCAALSDGGANDDAQLLDLLTPVAKSWSSEFGLIANDIAIQIHGGYGYTRDFDVEQIWRDNRLNPIHEGTTGIQGIDLLERKILKAGAAGLDALGRRIAVAAECSPSGGGTAVALAWRRAIEVIELLGSRPLEWRLQDSTQFLRAFGHIVIGWIWLELVHAADQTGDDELARGKAAAARYFREFELPLAIGWLDTIANGSDLISQTDDAMF